MTLHTSDRLGTVGEDVDDLRTYLHRLTGCPPVQHTQLLRCEAGHGGDAGVWFYVEADAEAGVARRRCLACGRSAYLLDSEATWTLPAMYACLGCGQSIVEVAVGLHTDEATEPGEPPLVDWLVLAARCVDCGRIAGLTDAHVPRLTVSETVAAV